MGRAGTVNWIALALVLSCSNSVEPIVEDDGEDPLQDEQTDTMDSATTSSVVQSVEFADVHPILVDHCGRSDCHGTTNFARPGFAVSSRSTAFDESRGFANRMWEYVSTGVMPLEARCVVDREFVEPAPRPCLEPEERDLLERWVLQGAAE